MSDNNDIIKNYDEEPMDVEEEQNYEKKKPVIGNSQDALKHFEKLLEKTENFALCLSAGDVDCGQLGLYFNFFNVILCLCF